MSELVHLIKHEAVPKCGSFEVRFSDGRPSRYSWHAYARLRNFLWQQNSTRPPSKSPLCLASPSRYAFLTFARRYRAAGPRRSVAARMARILLQWSRFRPEAGLGTPTFQALDHCSF
jgi:hypothetical protein